MKINLVNLYLDNEDYWFKLTLFSLTGDQALFSFLSVNNVPTDLRLCFLHLSPDCLESQGGNSNGSCCHFPFLYKGVPQSTCINKDRQVLWCATTDNYDMDNTWGYC